MNPAALCRRTPGGHQAVLIRYSKINKGAERALPGNKLSCAQEKQKHQGLRAWGWERAAPARGSSPRGGRPRKLPGRKSSLGRAPKPGCVLCFSWCVDALGWFQSALCAPAALPPARLASCGWRGAFARAVPPARGILSLSFWGVPLFLQVSFLGGKLP